MRFLKSKYGLAILFSVLIFGIVIWISILTLAPAFQTVESAPEESESVEENSFEIPDFIPVLEYGNLSIWQYENRMIDMFGNPLSTEVIEIENAETWELSEYERHVVCAMVCGEASNQSYYGKWLVCTCIRNACFRSQIQPSKVRIEYQYSGWNEEYEKQYPELWAEIEDIVYRVFDCGDLAIEDNILWFYNPDKSKGKFHNTQRFVIEEGNHRFYAEW
jgi:hypothetical protein